MSYSPDPHIANLEFWRWYNNEHTCPKMSDAACETGEPHTRTELAVFAAWSAFAKRQRVSDVLTSASVMAVSDMLDRDTFVRQLTEDKIAAEKQAEEAEQKTHDLVIEVDARYLARIESLSRDVQSLTSQLAVANAEIEWLRQGSSNAAKEIDRILRIGSEGTHDWRDLAFGFGDVRDGLTTLAKEPK